MTTFEWGVIVMLGFCMIELAWVGMRIDTKLFFIDDRLGIVFDMLRKLRSIDTKLSNIETDTSIIRNNFMHLLDEATGLPAVNDKLDKIVSIYFMHHEAKFNEMMLERMKQGLKDIPLYPMPEFTKTPFNPTCENKED